MNAPKSPIKPRLTINNPIGTPPVAGFVDVASKVGIANGVFHRA